MEENKYLIEKFLNSFFRIYSADIDTMHINDEKVTGIVKWKGEEDRQEFLWNIPSFSNGDLKYLTDTVDYLLTYKLTNIDKIIITEIDFKYRLSTLGWTLKTIENVINQLLLIDIRMIDNNEETDSFFIHF